MKYYFIETTYHSPGTEESDFTHKSDTLFLSKEEALASTIEAKKKQGYFRETYVCHEIDTDLLKIN